LTLAFMDKMYIYMIMLTLKGVFKNGYL